METRLHQNNGLFRYRKYEITPDTLLVDIKTDDERTKCEVSWLQVGFDEKIQEGEWSFTTVLKVFAVIIQVLFLVWAVVLFFTLNVHSLWFYLFFGPLFAGASVYFFHNLVKKEKTKKLMGAYEVKFYYLSKNEEEVDKFIAQIKIAQARFIRKEYRKARANEKI